MSAKTLSFQIVAPLQGWTYHIVMEATPAYSDNTAFSSLDVTALGAVLPTSPSNLVATLTSPTNVFLHWNDNSDNESGFDIYRSDDETFETDVEKIDTTGTDVNEYTDTLPDETTTYYYEVFAATPNGVVAGTGPVANGASPTTLPAGGESVSGAKNGPVSGIALQSVQFDGTDSRYRAPSSGFQSIALDSGAGAYPLDQPQYLDNEMNGFETDIPLQTWSHDDVVAPLNNDGSVNGSADHSWPLSYEESSPSNMRYIVTTPALHFAGTETGWLIEGAAFDEESGGGSVKYTFGPTVLNQSGTTLSATMIADKPLPQDICSGVIGTAWFISMDGGAHWSKFAADLSFNRFFVTGGAASGAYETVVMVGCDGGAGLSPSDPNSANKQAAATTNKKLADHIFKNEFANLNLVNAQGQSMSYWGNWARGVNAAQNVQGPAYSQPPAVDDPHTLAGLMKHHDGTCQAWTSFLVAVFSVEGLTSAASTVSPKVPNPTKNGTALDLVIKINLPGQDNPSPPPVFPTHSVVKFGGNTIFDPSYGKEFSFDTIAFSEWDWEFHCLLGVDVRSPSGDVMLFNPNDPAFAAYYEAWLRAGKPVYTSFN